MAFQLRYAPHFGMFRHSGGEDLIDQLKFGADHGFTAWEDNEMSRRPVEEQERIARAMDNLGMAMGVFVVNLESAWHASLSRGDASGFLQECARAVEVAKRVQATWMTVVPGSRDERLPIEYQAANVVDALRRAAEIFEPHGMVMVLEPLNPYRDHPGQFLAGGPQAFLTCRAVNSPSCKILFDIYHQQITEGNLIANIEACGSEIAYFQIGDNPGRNEPTTGEINYRNLFRHLAKQGYDGLLGMEHGNSRPGPEGELAVIEAYRLCDDF